MGSKTLTVDFAANDNKKSDRKKALDITFEDFISKADMNTGSGGRQGSRVNDLSTQRPSGVPPHMSAMSRDTVLDEVARMGRNLKSGDHSKLADGKPSSKFINMRYTEGPIKAEPLADGTLHQLIGKDVRAVTGTGEPSQLGSARHEEKAKRSDAEFAYKEMVKSAKIDQQRVTQSTMADKLMQNKFTSQND